MDELDFFLTLPNEDNTACPQSISKSKIKYIIKLEIDDYFDAHNLLHIQKQINYILLKNNTIPKLNKVIHIEISAINFKDKTVVLILELLLLGLLKTIDSTLYINCKMKNKEDAMNNFFVFSFLNMINRKYITSKEFIEKYKEFKGLTWKNIVNGKESFYHYRRFIDVKDFDDIEERYIYQSKVSSDINTLLKGYIVNVEVRDEICTMIDELLDNIFSHTNGLGLIDFALTEVKSREDDGRYYQFMINVMNLSPNYLYTNLRNYLFNPNMTFNNKEDILNAYNSQKQYFSDDNYSENLFFMVSAFQKGTTTRKSRSGGTGLNKTLINFAKRAQTNVPEKQSYVYSGDEIILFDYEILRKGTPDIYIAFNEVNNLALKPSDSCLSKSVFKLNGTAYNLMFIVEEDELC